MSNVKKSTIEVQGTAITVLNQAGDEYISLTDIAKHKEPDRSDHVIQNWMRNRNTIEFLGIWERLHNINFKPLKFEGFKNRAGLNRSGQDGWSVRGAVDCEAEAVLRVFQDGPVDILWSMVR